MKQNLLFVFFLSLPIMAFAETEEVDMEDLTSPPIRRSIAPIPKVFISDRKDIRIENLFDIDNITLIVKDSQGSIVYQSSGMTTYLLPSPLSENDCYSITVVTQCSLYYGVY